MGVFGLDQYEAPKDRGITGEIRTTNTHEKHETRKDLV